jgi:threonylcarbamoyladenosine tRNA methylthiotransferase MtaB
MGKFSLMTFGCRCNQADSAAIRESLCSRSMRESENHGDADLIVVNTCTVTQRTDKQVRQAVRRLHRENPSARLILTGCYAERDPEALAAMPGVSLVLGNADKKRLPDLIEPLSVEPLSAFLPGRVIHTPLAEESDYALPPMTHTGGKTRPMVKLQDGCDSHCSYCIVPKVRGPGRSAHPENVISEIQSLVDHGFREIVLAGINLGAFGRKAKEHPLLVDLLRRIVEIPRLGRIRLSSIEPMHFDRAIVNLAAAHPVIARHFHIPLQSGCDRILRRMRRPYTTARFRELVQYIKSGLPDAGLGTDVLVGFPGETEQDFEETCALIEELPLTYLHVFPFSPREGTEAHSLPDRIPSHLMKRRLNKVLELSRSKNLSFRRSLAGKVLPALTLAGEEDPETSLVLTGNYIHARIPGKSLPPNRLVDVRIEDVQPDTTTASLRSPVPSRQRGLRQNRIE